jgi:diguanylate cyclase (GGDEF)-like protein/putative nucleotidyltransferase with HDIG domain
MPFRAKVFIAITTAVGIAVGARAFLLCHVHDPVRFLSYLTIAVLASRLKVRLPGIDGTMSVNFLFVLLGVLELSLAETLVIGCAAGLAQCLWTPWQPNRTAKIVFNVFSMMANAVAASYWAYHYVGHLLGDKVPLSLAVAATAYFFANTLLVTTIVVLTEKKSFSAIWAECYFWSFPYYQAGAALVGLIFYVNRAFGWELSLLLAPVVYWIYRSYHLYLGRLDDEKRRVELEKGHAEELTELHLRTIEALALAIDAKDHTTHKHLNRVRTNTLEVGKEMGLAANELEALRAASLLHDIGKLAVPEHIISKPGRLTPEEFEKMKIHPVVGAEILERVAFPYAVAPIVRSHHEKWDGSGYPDGLKGEAIPIGARILAAVDFMDAMTSDRQYRKAVPTEEALRMLEEGAGKHFDPKVVEVLLRRYPELEAEAQRTAAEGDLSGIAASLHVSRGTQPAAGFERTDGRTGRSENDFLTSIAAARQEAQMLFELSQDLGKSLSLDETLSVLSVRLRKLIPYDSIVTFTVKENHVVPAHVSGDNFRLFSSLRVPMGEGLCGWVAENRKAIVNGNPAVEPGYNGDEGRFTTLRSALALPLEGVNGLVGVLALYNAEQDAFSSDHLRILQAISSKLALSVENAVKYQQAEDSATTDYLTGLPNARSLFLHLDREIARCARANENLAIMVCDVNGFKQVNDSFGHFEGDRLLRTFAQNIKDVCREYDYVARMGGDEFVIVVPGITPAAAQEKTVLFNAIAVQAGIAVCGREQISLSVGIAVFPEDGADAEQLLAQADRRMYFAKRTHYEEATALAAMPSSRSAAVN